MAYNPWVRVSELSISYPSFQWGAIANPDEININNSEIVNKLNSLINKFNEMFSFDELPYPDGCVKTRHYADGSIIDSKISITANIAQDKINSITGWISNSLDTANNDAILALNTANSAEEKANNALTVANNALGVAEEGVIISETVIVDNLYANRGRIAELTVNHLLTGDFLSGDTEIFYTDIVEDKIEFIQAFRNDGKPMVQYTTLYGEPLYWETEVQELMTREVTNYPVMVYQYDASVVFSVNVENVVDQIGQLRIPVMTFGRGDGTTALSSKGRVYKGRTGLIFEYFKSNTEDRLAVELNDDGIQFHGYPTIFTGTSEPVENLGKDGDIYVKF